MISVCRVLAFLGLNMYDHTSVLEADIWGMDDK